MRKKNIRAFRRKGRTGILGQRAVMRYVRQKDKQEDKIKFVALRDGKIVLSINGQEREVEFGATVDLSRLDDERLKEKIELIQWMDEHPERINLGYLARQYCQLYDIPYKEESNGISWSYDDGRKRVLVHDRPWYYTASTINYIVYGQIETPASRNFGVKYMTNDAGRILFKRFTEAIQRKTEQV